MTPERKPGSSSPSSDVEENELSDEGENTFHESDDISEESRGVDQNDHDTMEVDEVLSFSESHGNEEDDTSLGQNSFIDNASEKSIER